MEPAPKPATLAPFIDTLKVGDGMGHLNLTLVAEVFVLTRLRRHDKLWHGAQVTEVKGTIVALADGSRACYTERKPKFRTLCGSI